MIRSAMPLSIAQLYHNSMLHYTSFTFLSYDTAALTYTGTQSPFYVLAWAWRD